MITIEYLTELGKKSAARGSLSSPMVLIEYGKGRGVTPLADLATESNQKAIHEVGWQAGRNERQTGRVEQIAVIAEGRLGSPESEARPSIDPEGQKVLIISSWVKGSAAEHVIYHLKHQENGRVELSTFDSQPDRIESPVIDQIIDGYRDGQAALKREREKDRELG